MRIVVCGAGAAGYVAAARFSEDPSVGVTLLEATSHYRKGAWPEELAHAERLVAAMQDEYGLAVHPDAPARPHTT